MHKKVLTIDCGNCELCSVDDNNSNFICSWGKTRKGKIMNPPKGKQVIRCNLIKKKQKCRT